MAKRGTRSRRQPRTTGAPLRDAPVQGRVRSTGENLAYPFASLAMRDADVESALLTGSRTGRLEEYFGDELYRELRQLAVDANRASVRGGGARVLIVPGITGSKLGAPGTLLDDVIWVDPVDVALGRLGELALGRGAPRHGPLGVFLIAYLKLKLRLEIAGFNPDFFPYDWRLGLDQTGRALAEHLAQHEGAHREVHLIGHSMGGLVIRAALKLGARRVGRVIQVGTPNHGSFAVVSAIRGTSDTVRKLAFLDATRTPRELADQVFSTFPAIYQLFPSPDRHDGPDLFDASNWPPPGPDAGSPRPSLLAEAARVRTQALAPADERFALIAGVGRETIVGVRARPADRADGAADGFLYDLSPDGDGTVPLALAQLDGVASTLYVREEHGALCNNRLVARAIEDILNRGSTDVLPSTYERVRAAPRTVPEERLRVNPFDVDSPEDLGTRDLRMLLGEFVSPRSADTPATLPAAPGAPPAEPGVLVEADEFPLHDLVIERRRQHRVDLRLVRGNITDVEARACVLGVFDGVPPSGAAAAVNARLQGAIDMLSQRRMFSPALGQVYALPVARRGLPVDLVLLAGLGAYDRFDHDAQRAVAENIMRTCLLYRIEDLSTVLFGTGVGLRATASLTAILTGLWAGLRDSPSSFRFRGVTICEMDAERYARLRRELYAAARSPIFEDVAVTLDETAPDRPPMPEPASVRAALQGGPQPVYLTVQARTAPGAKAGDLEFESFVLGAGSRAVTIAGVRRVDASAWQQLRDEAACRPRDVDAYGARLAQSLLAPEVLELLQDLVATSPGQQGHPLRLNLDPTATAVPWETLRIGDASPAVTPGVTRMLRSDGMAAAKFLTQRQFGASLDVLLVVNPTEDLDGAETEGTQVEALLRGMRAANVTVLRGHEATRRAVLDHLKSGRYDAVHYAGHASFNAANRAQGGLICYNEEEITGPDIAKLPSLPAVMFMNACESGRVRRRAARRSGRPLLPSPSTLRERVDAGASLAEALLRGGVSTVIGTHWPVGDDSAAAFATAFYRAITEAEPVGTALLRGRAAVRDLASSSRHDWADYILYGDPAFRVKVDPAREPAGPEPKERPNKPAR